MTDTKVTNPTPAIQAEAGSSQPAEHLSSKKNTYNQWRNQKKKQQKNSAGGYPTTTARSKFTGRTPELKDRNFTMGANSGAIFSRSKKEYLIRVSRKNVDIEKYIAQGAPRQFKYPMMPQVPNPNYA